MARPAASLTPIAVTAQLHEGRFASSRGLTEDHVLGWLAHQIAEALDRDDGAAA